MPLQVRGDMVGVLNVFSFTPGQKFDEGHRKMLAVLASRAASILRRMAETIDDDDLRASFLALPSIRAVLDVG